MTAKIKTIRQLEDMTQKRLPNPKKIQNQLSKIKEETGETVYSTYTMLHAEKEREKIITERIESNDARMIHPDSLPTVRVDIRPVTAPGKTPTNQNRSSLPVRSKTSMEMSPSTSSEKARPHSEQSKREWGSAFQKIKIVQSITGGIQIENGRPRSRLLKKTNLYKSPDYAFIQPLKKDIRYQPNFAELQAKFWAAKFKQLIESWENEGSNKLRLRDILPTERDSDRKKTSRAANRVNEFIKNYASRYRWAFAVSKTPMADEDRNNTRADYVPIRHSELATIKDDMNKRIRETELIIQRSQTILKEVDNLSRLTKKVYEPSF